MGMLHVTNQTPGKNNTRRIVKYLQSTTADEIANTSLIAMQQNDHLQSQHYRLQPNILDALSTADANLLPEFDAHCRPGCETAEFTRAVGAKGELW